MYRYQMIHKSDGEFEEATDLVSETLKEIGKACGNGSVHALEAVLQSLQPDKLGRYLNAMIKDYKLSTHTYFTPLMVASAHGHDSIVRFLLQNYSHYCIVDAQNYSSDYDIDYDFDVEHVNKQTALWLAVQSEHFNVVQTLISLGKANVNQKADYDYTVTNRTPLNLACRNGQLEMVKYLIENGADLYHTDKDDSTSLMIASSCGHRAIVQYLLGLDDRSNHLLNAVDNKGSTVLHQAAYSGQLDIVKLLLEEHHAKIVKNNGGCTPLTEAGINNHEELVKYFIKNEKQPWYTISEVIDELELIGSYQLVGHDYRIENFKRAYRYLLRAMKLRYKDPQTPILKTNLLSPIEAHGYYPECQTIEELQLIGENGDENRLILECLMIRERMGVTSDFLQLLHDQADLFAYDLYSFGPDGCLRGYEECQRALQLWLHAYHLSIKTQISLDKCTSHLEKCVRVMGDLINRKRTKEIRFDMLMEVLQATENEFLRNKNLALILDVEQENEDLSCSSDAADETTRAYGDKCLYIILNLLFVATKILICSKKTKQKRRKLLLQRVQQFINSNYCTISDNKTLLHLSLMQRHNSTSIGICEKFPSLPVVQLLLSCRVRINAIDYHHYTPLHDLARNRFEHSTNEDLNDIKVIFKLLVDAGAHLDANAQGKTPEDCAQHEKLKSLFRKHPIQLSLKCICARMIQQKKLHYTDCISKQLQVFVQMH